jgi:hypothetical protein
MTSEWQTIDSAPKDGTRVLVYESFCVKTICCARWIEAPHRVWRADSGSIMSRATHWQPLPLPPEPPKEPQQ